MKCDNCEGSFLHKSPFRWFFRLLLTLTVIAYGYLLIVIVKDEIG